MKLLIAGATGAIGIPLSRRLRIAGHEIHGITRSDGRANDHPALRRATAVSRARWEYQEAPISKGKSP